MSRHIFICTNLIVLSLIASGCSTQPWLTNGLDGNGTFYAQHTPVATQTPTVLGSTTAYQPVAAAPVGEYGWDAPAQERQWRYVVIHHSATNSGNAAQFDTMHRQDRGWDELGYHFVIDNGRGGPDGRVEVGSRWTKQKHGAHTGGTPENEYNELGIGICLVGDFRGGMPTAGQLVATQKLVAYLCHRYDIPPQNVITHQDAPAANTECPGGSLHTYVHGRFKRELQPQLAGVCPAWRQDIAAR
jgi:hypothetical protein